MTLGAALPFAVVPLMPGTTALGFAKRGAGRAFKMPSRWQLGGPTMVPENLGQRHRINLGDIFFVGLKFEGETICIGLKVFWEMISAKLFFLAGFSDACR